MITSNDCWMKNECKKFNNLSKECLCRNSDIFCLKLFKLDTLYSQTLLSIPQRKRINLRVDSDGTDRDAFIKLKQIENDIETFICNGKNLYLYSVKCGNGKTAWAIRMIQTHLNNVWIKSDIRCRALFINVPRFLLALKDNISVHSEYIEHIKNNILSADIVVWDEVASKGFTEFEMENMFALINMRLDYNKSNIFTSNICGVELKDRIGDRLYSRIVNTSECIELKGADKRGLTI